MLCGITCNYFQLVIHATGMRCMQYINSKLDILESARTSLKEHLAVVPHGHFNLTACITLIFSRDFSQEYTMKLMSTAAAVWHAHHAAILHACACTRVADSEVSCKSTEVHIPCNVALQCDAWPCISENIRFEVASGSAAREHCSPSCCKCQKLMVHKGLCQDPYIHDHLSTIIH